MTYTNKRSPRESRIPQMMRHNSDPIAGHPRRVRSPGSADDNPAESPSLADVVERLSADFESQLTRPNVLAVTRRCRRELDIISGPALPEFVERLARQRLQDLLVARSHDTGA
jgi:hypothetical protein